MTEVLTADVVVVGGGSCGSVVAARLSEDPACSVILLESGVGFDRESEFPTEVRDARVLPVGPESLWIDTYPAELTPDTPRSIARGKVLGGSGAVNGAYFVRARPSDFDAWPSSWSFDAVLPYFRRLEADADFGGHAHGRSGPMPVTRVAAADRSEITASFVEKALAAGFADDPDKNDPDSIGGVGAVPRNVFRGQRVNTALAYLLPVLHRSNLTVLSSTTAISLAFVGTRVTGVTVIRDGNTMFLSARRVVLSAGAVRTPQLLMLSGVGPAESIRDHEISVVQDHPRVGQGFSDHPEVGVYYRHSSPPDPSSALEAVLHTGDLEIRPYSTSFDKVIPGLPIADPMVGVGLMRPESRGSIELVSHDPAAAPMVRYRYLESAADREALGAGVDVVRELMGGAVSMAEVPGDPLLGRLGTSLHLSGSCAMGGAQSVVDDLLQVRGVDGLDIVDTSVFPVVPSRGPHATAVMLAERASDLLRARLA